MIEKYNVQLLPLNFELAMLVREWRNSSRVNKFMDFKQQISVDAQEKWFQKVQKSEDYYFIISSASQNIGLIHLNRFNDSKKEAYAGLFVGNQLFEGTGAAFAASLALLDFAFEELHLDAVNAKTHQENKVALDYNKALGFLFSKVECLNFVTLKLDKQRYLRKRSSLVALLAL